MSLEMTNQERGSARRLFEIFVPRGNDDLFESLCKQSSSLSEFRVLMVAKGLVGPNHAEILNVWHSKLVRSAPARDGESALHELEHLSTRQVEIEEKLRVNETTLLGHVGSADESVTELIRLRALSSKMREAIIAYRAVFLDFVAQGGTVVETPKKLLESESQVDGRAALHELEILAKQQVDLERRFLDNEKILMDKLRALDGAATEVAQLAASVRELRAATVAYRGAIADCETVDSAN